MCDGKRVIFLVHRKSHGCYPRIWKFFDVERYAKAYVEMKEYDTDAEYWYTVAIAGVVIPNV